jgi:DNA-binding phage protein
MSILRFLRLEFAHFMYTGGQRSAERKRKMRLHTTFLDSAPKEVQRIGETLWAYVALVLAEEGARAEKMLHTFMDTLAEDVAHALTSVEYSKGIYDVAHDAQFRISLLRTPAATLPPPAKRVRTRGQVTEFETM